MAQPPEHETEPQAGETRADPFGSSLTVQAETASAAVAAQAQAAVQARFIMALQRPRDMDAVRVRLLKECKRPAFAKAAWFKKPIGKGVEGLSIRFAEMAIRELGNVDVDVVTVFDDPKKRILQVIVTDLERNATQRQSVTVTKTVERKKCPQGVIPLGSRPNSYGETVYILPATDDELLNKEGALVSKAMRTAGLRLIPADLKEECTQVMAETRRSEIDADPDAERKNLADAFAAINVTPDHLAKFLDHDLGSTTPSELDELRAIYTALRDGEATWHEVMDWRGTDEPAAPSDDRRAKLAEKLRQRKAVDPTPPEPSSPSGEGNSADAESLGGEPLGSGGDLPPSTCGKQLPNAPDGAVCHLEPGHTDACLP